MSTATPTVSSILIDSLHNSRPSLSSAIAQIMNDKNIKSSEITANGQEYTTKHYSKDIELGDNSEADVEPQDDDSELMREFGDFIVSTTATSTKKRDDDDNSTIDPICTLLELSIFDAIVHGKRYQNGVYVDDPSKSLIYTKYLERINCVCPDNDFQDAQNILVKLQTLVAQIAQRDKDFADYVHWLPDVLNWRINDSDNPKYKLIHLYYESPKTLDNNAFERVIEVPVELASAEAYMNIWIAVNWHLWVRLVVFRHAEIWKSCANSLEVFQKLSDEKSTAFATVRKSLEKSISFLESLAAKHAV